MKDKSKLPADHYETITKEAEEKKELREALFILFDVYNSGATLSPENYTKIKNVIEKNI